MSQNIIVNTQRVKRNVPGFHGLQYNQFTLPKEGEKAKVQLAIFEPTFVDFKTAPEESLGQMFTAPACFDSDVFVLSVKYSRSNASVFKGYLIDLCKNHAARGYKGFSSVHVPWESYGCPMVGSSLFLIFSKVPTLYLPEKKVVMPRTCWPSLRHHSTTGRNMSGRQDGSAVMLGLSDSGKAFLPNTEAWKGHLPVETQEGQTVKAQNFKLEWLKQLFGVDEFDGLESLSYITPVMLLHTLSYVKLPETHGQ